MRDTSDGELGIGLGDIKNGKTRLEEHDGLNKQIQFNKKYINTRLNGSLFALLFTVFLWSWAFDMSQMVKYATASLLLFFTFLYSFIYIKNKRKLEILRSEQMVEHRSKNEKS